MRLPPSMKETRPAQEVIDAFLSLRQASADLIITSRISIRPVVRVRHELMWLLRDLTHLTLSGIGQLVGGRDETTVRYGIDQVSDRIAQDDGYRREVQYLRRSILTGASSGMMPDLCLTAVRSVLANGDLSDAEARKAALQLTEARHG
ncbi:helix-turn-helix domain-containing protein [Pseudotabrizicola algicola]|uniref:Chromosomal replication initiator DnaA C-terminal domain-containing protein n=1 Tax=Pseudotabrizicola algicola TaxID=2709381 RepID=A0A6B3RNJ4_9RHOB|nr:helix-turn-helix domain-containing protein [Pseudotabrizicola algicola]NEX47630.1 hypothetical protein [Pseudotabrizicola algicola]